MPIAALIKKLFGRQVTDAELPGKPPSQWITNPWHAVSVMPGRGACAKSRDSVGTRFLSNQAPPLPLSGCTTPTCECRYRHHNDRRQALRRSADVWSARGSWGGRERRETRGRRASDLI